MCELLGMSANVPTDICFSFTGLMQRGGRTGPHRDGWGITFMKVKVFEPLKTQNQAVSPKSLNWCKTIRSKVVRL